MSDDQDTVGAGSDDPAPYVSSIFVIQGMDLDPDACTAAIGLIPTKFCFEAMITGKRVPSGEPFIRKPFWSIAFKKQRSYSIGDELDRLLGVLWPRRKEIVQFLKATSNEATFVTNVTIYHDRPLYELGPRTLKRLAYFGCEWGLDVFDYREDKIITRLE